MTTSPAPANPTSRPPENGVLGCGAVVEALREILAREGIRESRSAEQEGLFFTFDRLGEVSLQRNMTEFDSAAANADSFRNARNALTMCSSVLAERGFAVTLVMSPRTIALFARSETESENALSAFEEHLK